MGFQADGLAPGEARAIHRASRQPRLGRGCL